MVNNLGEKPETAKYTKVTNRITMAISKMTNLMDDLLTLGKLTSGKVAYNPEFLDLVKLCKDLTDEFNTVQIDGRRVEFTCKGNANMVYLDAKLFNL